MSESREIDESSPVDAQRDDYGGVERPSRGRAVSAVVCLVLAALLTTPAAIAYWGQRTLNDTQRYVATVQPLANSPEVQDVLATRVTDAIQKQVDVEAILTDVFAKVVPDATRLQLLVGPISGAVNGLIERQVRDFFASSVFSDIWLRANTRAQQALHSLLAGEDAGAVSIQGDEVVLDVTEVIDQVKQRLVDRGLTFVDKVPIPQTDRQIVLVKSPQLKQMRTIYAFSNPVAKWALPFVALLFLLSFVLARRRPRMTVAIGAVIAANALFIALALSIGRQLFTDQLSGTAFGPASRVFYDTMLAYLDRGQQVVLWLGLTLIVVGWFTGSNQYGSAVRNAVVGGLEQAGAALPGHQVGPVGRWVAANVRWLRVVVGVLGVVVLFWGNDVSLSRWWWSVVGVLVVLAVLQVLVGAGRRTTTEPTEPTQPLAPPTTPVAGVTP